METDRRATGLIALGATLISFAPILVKALVLAGLGPSAIGFWRNAFGAVALFGFAAATRTGVRLSRRAAAPVALAGVLFFLDLFVWHRSIHLVGAGMSTVLASTQVFCTAILSAVLFGERIRPRFVAAAVAGILGVALLVGVGSPVAFTPDYVRGIGYGLLTGVLYAGFLVSMRHAGRLPDAPAAVTTMAWMSVVAAVLLGVSTRIEGGMMAPVDAGGWVRVVLLALLAQAVGWLVISMALPRVPGSTGAILLLMQPVLATVWGALLFDETLTALQIIGMAITLVAVYVGSMRVVGKNAGKVQAEPSRSR